MSAIVDEVRDAWALPVAMVIVGASMLVLIGMILSIPVILFTDVGKEFAVFSAIISAITGGIAGYFYGKYLKAITVLRGYMETVSLGNTFVDPVEEGRDPAHEQSVTESANDVVSLVDTPLIRLSNTRFVRLADGLTREILLKVRASVNSGELTAFSQRAIDQAGVISRDPAVSPNAGDLISWLASNGFIEPIGNSRYELTESGTTLLERVHMETAENTGGPPLPPPLNNSMETQNA